MKKGKPEVWIIGIAHPSYLCLLLRPLKTIHEKYIVPDHEKISPKKLFAGTKWVTFVINSTINTIKKFGARRILYEAPSTLRSTKICERFLKTSDLQKFQEEYSSLHEFYAKDATDVCMKCAKRFKLTIGTLPPYKIPLIAIKELPFILSSTSVSDVKFFDDLKLYQMNWAYRRLLDIAMAQRLCAASDFNADEYKRLDSLIGTLTNELRKLVIERHGVMVENAKKMIVDKTVIICGDSHVGDLERGLSSIAYLLPSKHFYPPMKIVQQVNKILGNF